jgi:putative transposase
MLAEQYPLAVICEVVDCARSSYYHRPLPKQERGLRQAIEEVAASWPRYGYRRVTQRGVESPSQASGAYHA